MIIPDVNVLVYAFRAESAEHDAYRGWLTRTVRGGEVVGLSELVASGFIRVVTHRRIYEVPAPVSAATQFISSLLGSARVQWLHGDPSVWAHLSRLTDADAGLTGDRVPDAYLAATALAHGARLATADRGFARYPGLQFYNPC